MKARLIRAIPFFVLGMSLGLIGFPLYTWQFWVVVLPMLFATVAVTESR